MSDQEFRREVLRLAGLEVQTCIQCGTCSSSCPTAHLMNPSIRRLIKLCLEGKKEEALKNRTIWLCTSCQLCTVRCPRGIRPKAVVAACRDLAEKEGIKSPDQAYEKLFLDQIKEYGRIARASPLRRVPARVSPRGCGGHADGPGDGPQGQAYLWS